MVGDFSQLQLAHFIKVKYYFSLLLIVFVYA